MWRCLSFIWLTKQNISHESPPGRWSVYASESVTCEPSIELEVLHKTQKASPSFGLCNSNTSIRRYTAFQARSRISRQGSLSGKEHL
jgi:hypothetical protein